MQEGSKKYERDERKALVCSLLFINIPHSLTDASKSRRRQIISYKMHPNAQMSDFSL